MHLKQNVKTALALAYALVSVVLGVNEVSAASAPANTVIATLPVGGGLQIAADPTRGLVFVGNSVGVTVIDEATFATTVIPLPEGIRCVVVDPIHWTIYAESGTSIYAIDERTYTVLGSPIPLPTGEIPLRMGLDPFKGLLYSANDILQPGGGVAVIDERTNTVLDIIHFTSLYGFITSAGVDHINNLVFVTGGGSTTAYYVVYVVEQNTRKIVKTFTLPTVAAVPQQVVANPVSREIYVAAVGSNDATGTVTIMDEATGAVKHVVSFPAGVAVGNIAVDPFTHTLYTSDNNSSGNAFAVDTRTGTGLFNALN
jgi:hypothetical protein